MENQNTNEQTNAQNEEKQPEQTIFETKADRLEHGTVSMRRLNRHHKTVAMQRHAINQEMRNLTRDSVN